MIHRVYKFVIRSKRKVHPLPIFTTMALRIATQSAQNTVDHNNYRPVGAISSENARYKTYSDVSSLSEDSDAELVSKHGKISAEHEPYTTDHTHSRTQQALDISMKNEEGPQTRAADGTGRRAENYVVQLSQPAKKPVLHHQYVDRLPQQAELQDFTQEIRDLEDTPIAAVQYTELGNFVEPRLNWWDRRRCGRIQGTISLCSLHSSRMC